ncbi:MAG TPA: hypothetical protein VLI67_00025 [Vicinamibacteria bacterium]|nr:hypothetical protein [Vicinamibacteria bacterium]
MSPYTKHESTSSEALDGRLPEPRRRAVEDLLRACPECRAAYEAMAWTRAQVRRSTAGDLPPALDREIRHALDREALRLARRSRPAVPPNSPSRPRCSSVSRSC